MRMVESCRDVLNKNLMISQKTDTDELTETVRIMTATQNCSFSCWYVVVARSTFPSQNVQSTPCSEHFWSWDVAKVYAAVARSTFPSQNVQSTPFSDHFWKLRCRKRARRFGAKHVSKSKCLKHHMFGPLLDVQMSFRVADARDCASGQKWAKREGFLAFLKTMAHVKRIWKDAFSLARAVIPSP